MTKQEFDTNIIDALTASCNIPFKIPAKSIERISKYTADWFYRNYEDAVDNLYVFIPFSEYSKDSLYKSNRGIILPKCVYSVNAVTKSDQYTQGSNILSNPDFTLNKFVNNSYGIAGSNSVEDSMYSDAVLAYVVYGAFDDLLYHVTKHPLSYTFNRLNKRLFIKGDVSSSPDLILDVYVTVPLEALYELDLFYNYVLGKSYMELGNILGAFEMELPGNVRIDYSKWYDNGEKMVDAVVEEVKALSSNSFFFTTNGS